MWHVVVVEYGKVIHTRLVLLHGFCLHSSWISFRRRMSWTKWLLSFSLVSSRIRSWWPMLCFRWERRRWMLWCWAKCLGAFCEALKFALFKASTAEFLPCVDSMMAVCCPHSGTRVTTCPKNLEVSGNLTAVREMSGNCRRKSCWEKLYLSTSLLEQHKCLVSWQ